MKKTKQPNKKLVLAKETVRELDGNDLPKAAGGATFFETNPTTPTTVGGG